MQKMSEIVFQCHAGGLGDSILYSTLPELWVREQNAEVYIQDGFRNDDIRKMWLKNPFISGIVNSPSTHIMSNDDKLAELCTYYDNSIKGTEAYFGFTPKNDYPKVYFDLYYSPVFSDKTLVDFNAITASFTKKQIEDYVAHLCRRKLIRYEDLLVVRTLATEDRSDVLPEVPRYDLDLETYAIAIYSCKSFVTVSSGASALASAIKGHNPYPKVHCLIHQAIFNKKIWHWNNLDYYVVGKTHDDFADF